MEFDSTRPKNHIQIDKRSNWLKTSLDRAAGRFLGWSEKIGSWFRIWNLSVLNTQFKIEDYWSENWDYSFYSLVDSVFTFESDIEKIDMQRKHWERTNGLIQVVHSGHSLNCRQQSHRVLVDPACCRRSVWKKEEQVVTLLKFMFNAPKPPKVMLVRCDWQPCFANVYRFPKPGSLVSLFL